MTKYPMEVNGWHYSLDADSMSYWKDFEGKREFDRTEAVALCWLDTVEGDEGYNSEGDCYVLIGAEGRNEEEALNNLYDTTVCWGEVMRRAEAEKELIKYMETH